VHGENFKKNKIQKGLTITSRWTKRAAGNNVFHIMKGIPIKKYSRVLLLIIIVLLGYFVLNGIRIYNYSFRYSEDKSDAAIVLGAGTSRGQLSKVFKERINHSMYLYNAKVIRVIILTGGYGDIHGLSDSEIAKKYILTQGIPEEVIFIEKKSKYTIENLVESKRIMDSLRLSSALIVTDPFHMKRSMGLANKLRINCKPSPTKTTMYRSFLPKTKSLIYETFFYSLGQIAGKN
jgi:uncharacterized SAM-binding protein YcdF (DUF218 family)